MNIQPPILEILSSAQIDTLGQLLKKTEDDLMKLPRIDRQALHEIKDALAVHGLNLKKADR